MSKYNGLSIMVENGKIVIELDTDELLEYLEEEKELFIPNQRESLSVLCGSVRDDPDSIFELLAQHAQSCQEVLAQFGYL